MRRWWRSLQLDEKIGAVGWGIFVAWVTLGWL